MRISDWSSDVCSSDLIARVKMEDGRARFRRFDRRGSDLIRSHWQVRTHGRRVDGTCHGAADNDLAHGNSWYVRMMKGSGVAGVPRQNSEQGRIGFDTQQVAAKDLKREDRKSTRLN